MTASRGVHIAIVAVAFGVATIGLVSGVRGTGRDVGSYAAASARPAAEPARARSYRDMRETAYGPNAALPASWWHALRRPDVFAPVVQTAVDRDAALARRAARRAFEGAPPIIPHEIDQLAIPACLTCHERGAVIAGLTAPAMSHRVMGSCVQCHAVAAEPRGAGTTAPVEPPVANDFVGARGPHGGARVWPGAPPTIPHTTWMRDRCDSCHGVFGKLGMKSTHPWRASCTQCHALSAALDQRAPEAGR